MASIFAVKGTWTNIVRKSEPNYRPLKPYPLVRTVRRRCKVHPIDPPRTRRQRTDGIPG